MRHHRKNSVPEAGGPAKDPDRAAEARERIRNARAAAEAAMEERRQEVRADLERRMRELADGRAA